MTLICTGVSRSIGNNGPKTFFNFRNGTIDLTVEVTGTMYEPVYEQQHMTPMVLEAIEAGVFDGEIEERFAAEGEPETFTDCLKRVLSHKN